MRDVATYEANLSDESNLRKTLMIMHKKIDNTKKSLSENSQTDDKFLKMLSNISNGLDQISKSRK